VIRFSDLVEGERGKTPVALHHQVTAAGFEIVWAEVTTPDVTDFDFRVVRTVIPGMQPLDNDHRYRYLGGRRLPRVKELNPDPHPFP
jgi:ribosomal protein S12 methylthiotransferase accessory factor YcaO